MRLVQIPSLADNGTGLHGLQPRSSCRGGPIAVQSQVAAPLRDELLVRPLLDDSAMLEDDDEIGIPDRREPVGDDDGRAAGEEPAKRELDAALGADVDARRRLVED